MDLKQLLEDLFDPARRGALLVFRLLFLKLALAFVPQVFGGPLQEENAFPV